MTDESLKDSAPEPRERRGFFAKVRRGLFMTHTEILEKLGTAVKKGLGIDEAVLESLEAATDEGATDFETLRRHARKALGKFINERTKRRPTVIPVVMEV